MTGTEQEDNWVNSENLNNGGGKKGLFVSGLVVLAVGFSLGFLTGREGDGRDEGARTEVAEEVEREVDGGSVANVGNEPSAGDSNSQASAATAAKVESNGGMLASLLGSRKSVVGLPPQEDFISLQKDASGKPVALRTAISTYQPQDGSDVKVTLIGAVHVADSQYYHALNSEFERYDPVLYELIAKRDTRPGPAKDQPLNLYSLFQQGMGELIQVEHQLNLIDYKKANLVHADLSMEELIEAGKRRGESGFTFAAGIALDVIRLTNKLQYDKQTSGSESEKKTAPEASFDADGMFDGMQVRRDFAAQFAEQDFSGGMPGWETLNPYVIDLRNDAAMKGLDEQLAAGKTNIAIFYGAAHLPDFEQRLIEDYKMVRTDTRWLVAWDLTKEIPKRRSETLFFKVLETIGRLGSQS